MNANVSADISVIVPVADVSAELGHRLDDYSAMLRGMGRPHELIVVSTLTVQAECARAVEGLDSSRVVVAASGWGAAVRMGLAEARGALLCYLNWRRTSAQALQQILHYALGSRDVVFRANRRTRDTFQQRVGSLLFNLECRALLGTSTWDVNGTPKVFGREHKRLLELRSDDGLIDAELALVCEQEDYGVVEVPIDANLVGKPLRPDYWTAVRLYLGVVMLAWRHRSRARRVPLEA